MLNGSKMDQVDVDMNAAAATVVDEFRAAPCAVVGAAIRRKREWLYGFGEAGKLHYGPTAPPVRCDTVFDLASLTKPLVALTVARCQRLGWLQREQRLAQFLPWLARAEAGATSLDALLAHRAGLVAHREFFVAKATAKQLSPREILAAAAAARRSECVGPLPPQGFPAVYSDLGYMLTGAALGAATSRPLEELVAEQVAEPLGLRLGSARQLGLDTAVTDSRAVSEGGSDRCDVCVAPTEDVQWRGGVLRGVVHDENAWVLAGRGLAGHAGAFGDLRSVLRFGTSVLAALAGRREQWLSAAELLPALQPRPGGPQCAGFELRSGPRPSSGCRFGGRTFGHLGFTGTSIWIDPDRELVGVLLTNRVHPSREAMAIREPRPATYDRIFELMTSES